MKPQEIFNTVINHLYTQKKKSIENKQCLYHGPKNTKCAVGCLIPDELYLPEFDTTNSASVLGITMHYPKNVPSYFKDNLRLLGDLQRLHDNSDVLECNTFDFISLSLRITELSDIFNLKIPKIVKQ